MSFPRYEAYRDSGAEWLGEVPSPWNVRPLKHLVTLKSGGTPSKENPAYWNGDIPWASAKDLKSDNLEDTVDHITRSALNEGAAQLIAPGSVVVLVSGMMLARTFPVCRTSVPMAINQDLKAIEGRPGVRNDFLAWLLRGAEPETLNRLDEAGHGTKALRMETWLSMPTPQPTLQEQGAIADFLDRETGKIDVLVDEQRRLIELLKEKRQAVISHAVTKGLDPTAPMKNSGVEWLGEVPAHWSIAPMKRVAMALPGWAFPSTGFSTNERHVRLLRGVNVAVESVRWEDTVYWERQNNDRLEAFELHAGDVVLGMDRPWIGDGLRLAKIGADDIPALLLQRVAAVRPRDGQCGEYLFWALNIPAFFHHCAPEMTGVSVPHISGTQIETYRVPVPPETEQKSIVNFIEDRCCELDVLCREADIAITLLQERRAALISAAVTGKIDVGRLAPFEAIRAA